MAKLLCCHFGDYKVKCCRSQIRLTTMSNLKSRKWQLITSTAAHYRANGREPQLYRLTNIGTLKKERATSIEHIKCKQQRLTNLLYFGNNLLTVFSHQHNYITGCASISGYKHNITSSVNSYGNLLIS